ncbi:MAG: hypothetical protein KCHDKBKB_01557 [Elusimicrobia bacterium]|nr:hypothetical protein [Elusimicrobiota bacterium]
MTAILIMVVCTGCSAVIRYRGLSPQVNKKEANEDLQVNNHYRWKFSKHGAGTIYLSPKKHRVSFLVYTNAGEEQILTLGPAFLPLIPWPPGIYKAITKHSPDAVIPSDLLISLNVGGRYEDAKLQIDFSNVEIEIEPQMETKGVWQVQHWTSQTHYEYEPINGLTNVVSSRYNFRLTLSSISSAVRKLKIKFNDVRISGERFDLPPIVFEKGTGYGMNPGVIND